VIQQEAERRDFFEKLGRAIREWQLVEMELFRVYARLVRCEDAAEAAKTFHEISGFRNRLKVTDAAALTVKAWAPGAFDPAEWDRLHELAGSQSEVRNRVAHWTVYFRIPEGGPLLRPSHFSPKHAKSRAYEVEDLVTSAVSFASLAGAMRIFANSLPIPPGSPPLV
jgi:hypothetical protein